MTRRRFRWTRERYRKAEHLSRYFSRHVYDLPSESPSLLERFWELWRTHPQRDDPLTTPIRVRCAAKLDNDIPF